VMFEIIVLISCSKGDCPLLTFELLVLVSMEFNCAKTVIKREAYPIDNCAKTVLKRGLSPFVYDLITFKSVTVISFSGSMVW